jgi:hypothetical protein
MRMFALGLLAIAGLGISAEAQKIEGVWSITEVTTTGPNAATEKSTQPSMYLFTKKHYSIIYVASDKPRNMTDSSKMTADQLRKVFVESFIANAGTYEFKAGKLTMHPMVAKSPGYMQPGNWTRQSVKITGNTMTLTSDSTNAGQATNPTTIGLTRVE